MTFEKSTNLTYYTEPPSPSIIQ